MILNYKIADVVFGVDIRFKGTDKFMRDYLAPENSKPEFIIRITDEDIENEKKLGENTAPDRAYEITAIYRQFISRLIESYNAFFFHCSAIEIDGKAVMFTAQSGTGKSTHRRLWQKNFGDRVTVINDDKPVIRRIDGVYYVYGTPWCGKEGLNRNTRAVADTLCFLSRAEENSIEPFKASSMVAKLFEQTLVPKERNLMINFLGLLDGFINQVKVYDLRVNMKDEAAVTAYNEICKAENF